MFNYKVRFPDNGDNVILIAPNGYGKTALLSLLNNCLQLKFDEASKQSFKSLTVKFEDQTVWTFEKEREKLDSRTTHRLNSDRERRSEKPTRDWVRLTITDPRGQKVESMPAGGTERIPIDILAEALDFTLPIVRVEYDMFRDLPTEDSLTIPEVIERYRETLSTDNDFRRRLGSYAVDFTTPSPDRPTCVFIETQRLLYARKSARREAGTTSGPEEEISREGNYLAKILQAAHQNYASTSQAPDESFPNRLIARAAKSGPRDLPSLRAAFDMIERRRKFLIEAGILIETSEPLRLPPDKDLDSVADALAIYLDDSKAKLSTFDDIYPKVSVFRALLNKKLKPKELQISRERGAFVTRQNETIDLVGLSSGEKHEFIMLFKLIFETPPSSLVLIDEPEISLHVLWQLEFMPDLFEIQEANRFQAIIATHSPQIFQGVEHLIVDLADQAY